MTGVQTCALPILKVNARGDAVGHGKEIVAGRNQIMDQIYQVSTDTYSPNSPSAMAERQAIIEAANIQKLSELANNLTVPVTQDSGTTTTPAARGSLASSVAKPVTVTQEAMPNPKEQKKSQGPGRI